MISVTLFFSIVQGLWPWQVATNFCGCGAAGWTNVGLCPSSNFLVIWSLSKFIDELRELFVEGSID